MSGDDRIVVIGAGVFGLTTALQLWKTGHTNIVILDRHVPPVPDGSSSDISRVIRFDYGDQDYLDIAYEAYLKWSSEPRYKDIFHQAPYVLGMDGGDNRSGGAEWLRKTTAALDKRQLPWQRMDSIEQVKALHPTLAQGSLAPNFIGYLNQQAGWADASKAIAQLRDECLETGAISFVCGPAGTVTGFDLDNATKTIRSVRTLANIPVAGTQFIFATGTWVSGLVPMYNTALSTAQVIAYMRLSDDEMKLLSKLPIYANFSSGWFNFPPHEDTRMLKMAVHGWGYTRKPDTRDAQRMQSGQQYSQKGESDEISSTPPLRVARRRPNFVPADGEERLRAGLREILPQLADRPFEHLAMCWYTDTPTGDFIMDYHPDHPNLFVAGGGSGHAFKFLPVLGKYTAQAFMRQLPPHLARKWRFRTEYREQKNVFRGDGSRAGPARRELRPDERARL